VRRSKPVNLLRDPEWVEYLVYEFFLIRIPLRTHAPTNVAASKAFAKRFLAEAPEWFELELKRHQEADSTSTEFVDAIGFRLRVCGLGEFPNLLERPAGPFLE
jgi:hypothetical protein